MDLPEIKSPVRKLDSMFAVRGDDSILNTFIPLGKAPKGRYHFAFFYKDTVDWGQLEIDQDSVIEHNGSFTQYLVKSIEGIHIGSLLVVNPRRCLFAPYKLAIKDKDTTTEFSCMGESGTGGILVYNDTSGNSVAIALTTRKNSFLVSVGPEGSGD